MSTHNNDVLTDTDPLAELRAHAEALEQKLAALQRQSNARVIHAELKVEAVRQGMIDLDGIKLLDLTAAELSEAGEFEGAAQLMANLKRTKPWMFGSVSSSSAVTAPPAQPLRQKLATEMTDAEYRVARAALLKQKS